MTYLRRPSTYVIAAAAIVVYLFVWPMVRGLTAPKQSGS